MLPHHQLFAEGISSTSANFWNWTPDLITQQYNVRYYFFMAKRLPDLMTNSTKPDPYSK